MIYRAGDAFVIANPGGYLPGSFESERAARYAFRFDLGTLQRLSEEVCAGEGKPITFERLQRERVSRAVIVISGVG